MIRFIILAAAFAATISTASAQDQRPYAGLDERQVKALSPQQIDDLRNGRGMGLALAAELNFYPGPTHVLELAADLRLAPAQRMEIERLFAAMKAETIPLGERLITEETALDRLFRDKSATPANLAAATGDIGVTQARLRAAHLGYHLSTATVLTAGQIARYAGLRGYSDDANVHGGHRK